MQLGPGTDQGLHAAVLCNVRHLVRKQNAVDGHIDRTRLGNGENRNHLLDGRVEEDADPFAPFDSQLSQSLSQAGHQARHFTVSQPALAVHQRLFVRKAFGAGAQHVVDQIIHGSVPFCLLETPRNQCASIFSVFLATKEAISATVWKFSGRSSSSEMVMAKSASSAETRSSIPSESMTPLSKSGSDSVTRFLRAKGKRLRINSCTRCSI